MTPIQLYQAADKLRNKGLSEREIGIRLDVRQWTISRVLKLSAIHPLAMILFERHGMATLSALLEVASNPAPVQFSSLAAFEQLVGRRRGQSIRRRDVAMILAWRSRNLDRAPFPTTACRSCMKRTGVQADFFGDVKPGALGICKDAACFARCMNAVIARRARWASKKTFRAIPPGDKKRKAKK